MTAGLARDGEADVPYPAFPDAEVHARVGPYRLVSQLGEGGMGVVHLAVDPHGRAVAIKVLRDHIAHDSDARARLSREVETLARVQHPRVAAVLDADTVGGRPYIVTRYVPGPPLDQVVARSGPLDASALLRLGRGLSDALRAIHAAGVIHRDLKPANVLLLDGEPVVIDFGIAHVADDIRLTMTGLVMGTPGYLSPEIVEGAPVTHATDWWGWAATLAFAAKGAPPFGRGPMDVVLDRVRRGQADLTGVDARLVPLLQAALSPDASVRPHADDVVAAMDRYAAGGDTTTVVPVSSPYAGQPDAGPGTTLQHVAPGPEVPVIPATRPMTSARTAVWPEPPDDTEDVRAAVWPPPPGAAPMPAPPAAYRRESMATALPDQHQGHPWPSTAPDSEARRASGAHAADPDALWQHPTTPAVWQSREAMEPGGQPGTLEQDDVGRPGDGESQAGPPANPDPRIGKERRTWTLLAALFALVGLAAGWPVVAGAAVVLLTWLARFTDRSATSLVMRRYEHGRRRSDQLVTGVLAPWHLVTSALATVMGLLLPLLVFAATAFSVALGMAMFLGGAPQPDGSVSVAGGLLAGLLVAWWGPGGASLRRGSRSIVRALSSRGLAKDILATALVLLGLGFGAWAWLHAGQPQWWPFTLGDLPSYLRIRMG